MAEEQQQRQEKEFSPTKNSPTGIDALDDILKGGFTEGSVVLLAGDSGTGKTILSFQWLFEGIERGENTIYITSTEPLFKTLRNLEKLDFYDRDAVEGERLKVLDLRDLYGYGEKMMDIDKILDFIEEQVKEHDAKRLCIDSVTAIAYRLGDKVKVREFIFQLGKVLSTLGCTAVLTSEVGQDQQYSVYGVEEFISDAIIKMDRTQANHGWTRFMEIVKVRGKDFKQDKLDFKITSGGITAFPNLQIPLTHPAGDTKLSLGNDKLDTMVGGGIYNGSVTLLSGPTGAGKTTLAMQFTNNGLENGENCLYASFEESIDQVKRNAQGFGWDFEKHQDSGKLVLRSMYPSERYLQEHLAEIIQILDEKDITRCVIDSLSALENSFPQDAFLDFTRQIIAVCKSKNITPVLTVAVENLIGSNTITQSHISTMMDNIIMLSFSEIEGQLRHVLNIVKIRGSDHSKGLRTYNITGKGIVVGTEVRGYRGVLGGTATKVSATVEEQLHSEFKKFVGPMADSVFEEIKDAGLTQANILSKIDEMEEENIISSEDAEHFESNVANILSQHITINDKDLRDYIQR